MIDYLLPGQWRDLQVRDSAASGRAVAAYVRDTVGRRDDLAAVRRQAIADLNKVLEEARSSGASAVHLAYEALPGIPLPVSLIVNVLPHGWADDAAMLTHVESIRSDPSRLISQHTRLVELDDVSIVERVRRLSAGIGDGTASEVLKHEVWLADPGRLRTALFTFSTMVTELAPALQEMCLAIALTTRWR